jgi:hypothetical protein
MRLFPDRSTRTVATVGLAEHGKTVFLAALFWDSFCNLAPSFDNGYTVSALSPEADLLFWGNAEDLQNKRLPRKSPRVRPEPATLEFRNIPSPQQRGTRNLKLTFYDIAGEVFTNDQLVADYAPYLAQADDIIFLFDPTHASFSAFAAARLVDLVYRNAKDAARKNIIIALSKMDELRGKSEWGEMIGDYWPDRPPAVGMELAYYLRDMEHLSDTLRGWWLSPEHRAYAFLNKLPQETTHFCAFSSLGQAPREEEGGGLVLEQVPHPFRVRDPLFWIFRAAGVM